MQTTKFVTRTLWIERSRRREGPKVVYTVYAKNSSRCFTDHKAILKHVKWPKGTPTGDALREWLQSFEPNEPEDQTKSTKSTKPTSEDDPTANTKMIT
jgi:hypothetical protein